MEHLILPIFEFGYSARCMMMVCRFLWAKPSIEDLFMSASERRLLFSGAEREELDELVTKMRTTQVGRKRKGLREKLGWY